MQVFNHNAVLFKIIGTFQYFKSLISICLKYSAFLLFREDFVRFSYSFVHWNLKKKEHQYWGEFTLILEHNGHKEFCFGKEPYIRMDMMDEFCNNSNESFCFNYHTLIVSMIYLESNTHYFVKRSQNEKLYPTFRFITLVNFD